MRIGIENGAQATYDWTGLDSRYAALRLTIAGLLPVTDGANLEALFYMAGVLEDDAGDYDYALNVATTEATNVPAGSTSSAHILLRAANGNAAGEGIAGTIAVFDMPLRPKLTTSLVNVATTGVVRSVTGAGSYIAGAGALTGVQLRFSTGNIASGWVMLEGLLSV